MNMFDHWKNLTSSKVEFNEDDQECESSYDPRMMTRFLSMFVHNIFDAAELAKYDLPKDAHYRYLFNILPKKYMKVEYMKSKKTIDNEDSKLVSKYFEFGTRDTEVAMKILTPDIIQKIKLKYGKLK